MNQTTVTAGQSLVDVAIQELGSVAALFALADAAGLAITDALTPGEELAVPAATAARPELASYFRQLDYRVNTGAEVPPAPVLVMHDYQPTDFAATDFL